MFFLPKVRSAAAFLSILAPLSLLAVPPTIDPFTFVTPDVPVGKSLVIPVSTTNPDGTTLEFTVTSSNPLIPARVKTGNPILRLRVKYEGTNPFEGDLDLQLFRDIAPVTVGFITGFAQSGFYDNRIFHRVIRDFVVQGGDPLGTGQGGPGFTFEHEFRPSLIFSGIGQFAMANSAGGYNRGVTNRENPTEVPSAQIGLGDFSATNGSQFFITTSNQHGNLDFKHTIFGQLVRGFPLLAQINAVPVGSGSKPTTDVRVVTARILPGRSEATIIIGARAAGTSTIRLTAEDALGNQTSREFVATGRPDPINTRPVLLPLTTAFASLGEFPPLLAFGVDVEGDRNSFGIAGVRPNLQTQNADFLPNFIGFSTIVRSYGTIGEPGVQTFAVGLSGYLTDSATAAPFNDPANGAGEFAPFESYTWQVQRFVIGKKPVRTEELPIDATAATAATFVVGKFSDTDPTAAPSTHSAVINWGDGTAVTPGTVARDNTRPGAALFMITGSHTYAQPGIYTATAILNWNVPTLQQNEPAPEIARIRSTVYVSAAAAAIRAQGATLDVKAPRGLVSNRILANFTDTNRSRRASDYLATIDWGDGILSSGAIVKAAPGRFAVRGSHTYRDPETYPLSIRIHPRAAADETGDAVTWSTLNVSGFTAPPHLPPFPVVNLRAAWRLGPDQGEGIDKGVLSGLVNPYVPANLAVQLRGLLEIGNSGNKTSSSTVVRSYLSTNATLEKTGTNADPRLVINGFPEVTVGTLAPGAIVNTGATPWVINLPRGESGGGKYLLTEVVYSDPIVDANDVPKFSVIRLPARIFGFDRSSNTFTTQDGVTKVTFRVVLDTLPTATVTIPVSSSVPAQGTVSAASLVFTPANFNIPQTVTVTGVNDNNANTVPYNVVVGTSTSTDPVLNGLPGFTINLTNRP